MEQLENPAKWYPRFAVDDAEIVDVGNVRGEKERRFLTQGTTGLRQLETRWVGFVTLGRATPCKINDLCVSRNRSSAGRLKGW